MSTNDFRDAGRGIGGDVTVSPSHGSSDDHVTGYDVRWFGTLVDTSDTPEGAHAVARDLERTIAENRADDALTLNAVTACLLGGLADADVTLYDTCRKDLGHGFAAEPLLDASGNSVACYQLVRDGIVHMHCPDLDSCERVVAKLS